jgi:TPR repeat protein
VHRLLRAVWDRLTGFSPEAAHRRGLRAAARDDFKAAAAAWTVAARAGHVEAQVALARLYDQGQGVLRVPADALGWYRRAAETGHADAQLRLAEMLLDGVEQPLEARVAAGPLGVLFPQGVGISANAAEALRWARTAAGQGLSSARALEGYILASGLVGPPDSTAAAAAYEAAATDGDLAAQVAFGLYLLDPPDGRTADPAGAADWFRRAAEGGHAHAWLHLGNLLASGRVGSVDFEASADCLRRAAEGGISAAHRIIGAYHLIGLGVAKDPEAAERCLARAAASGDPDAMVLLGDLRQVSADGPADYLDAARWFRDAAALGHATAQRLLAQLYLSGSGVARNERAALTLMEQSAEGGDVEAQVGLGVLLSEGLEIPHDPLRAAHWFEVAAANGNPDAAYNIGTLHSLGQGRPQSLNLAVRWWHKAAEQGSTLAEFRLGVAYASGIDDMPRDDFHQCREDNDGAGPIEAACPEVD